MQIRKILLGAILTGCVLIIATPMAIAETDVYGSIRLGLEMIDTDDGNDNNDDFAGRNFLSRFGIKASKELGNGLTAIGRIEYGLDPTAHRNEPALRLGYAGLSGAFGQVTFGSQTLVWHSMVRGAFFNDGADSLRMGTIRDSDLLNYWYNKKHKKGPVAIGAAVQLETGEDGESIDNYTLGIAAKLGPVKLKAAALMENQNADAGVNDGEDGLLAGIRIEYAQGPIKVAGFAHQADEDFDTYNGNNVAGEETTTYGLYAMYKLKQHVIHGRYAVNTSDVTEGDPRSIKAEYVYHMDKKLRFWVSYENFDGDNRMTDYDEIQLGLRYDF